MSATATPTPMEAAVQKLVDQGKTLSEALESVKKTLDKPDYSGLRRYDAEGRVTSFMEDADEELNVRFTNSGEYREAQVRKSYHDTKKSIRKSLHTHGYCPIGKGSKFCSFTDFVRRGLENPNSQAFQEDHRAHFGTVQKAIEAGQFGPASVAKAVQGMSVSSGADGGFTVMPEFSNKIFDRVYANDLFGRTDNYSVTGNNMTFLATAETSRATGSRRGGVQGYWMSEGGTITKSKPTLREVTLKLVKLGAVVYLTEELLSDGGTAMEQYVAKCVAEEFNFLIGDSLINGTGVGQPLGILNAPSLVSVAKESGQLAATIQPENIVKMESRFYAPNNGNSVWLKNQDINPQLQLMTLGIGAAGQVVYMPPGGMSVNGYETLQGRPTLTTEFNATLGTQGDLIKADLGQILSISKGGIVQAVSVHVEFLTDQQALRFTMRLMAKPWESAPITPYKGTSNTQSNFIALDTRA
jgi:HK97 family phage major capsid protein